MGGTHATLDSDKVFHSVRRTVQVPDYIDTPTLIFDYEPRHPDEVSQTRNQGKAMFIDGCSGRTISFEEARRLTDGVAKVLRDRLNIGWDDVVCVYSPSRLFPIHLFLQRLIFSTRRRRYVRPFLLEGSPTRCHCLFGQSLLLYIPLLTEYRKLHGAD
jgi:hypothetical protein